MTQVRRRLYTYMERNKWISGFQWRNNKMITALLRDPLVVRDSTLVHVSSTLY